VLIPIMPAPKTITFIASECARSGAILEDVLTY
jgi:hypothetical protein